MRIWGPLEKATLEILGADPAQGVQARVWFNSVSKQIKIDDGTTIHTLQYSDQSSGFTPKWELNANAPIQGIDAALNKVYLFAVGGLQAMYTAIKVPNGYLTGRQIILNVNCYSPGVADAFHLQSLTTLIRATTDNIASTTNQRTSTNTPFVMSAPTASVPQRVQLDLTDAAGLINGVAVSPNDLLLVKLSRIVTIVPADGADDVSVLDTNEVVF